MTQTKKYNPTLKARLTALCSAGKAAELRQLYAELTVLDRRTADYQLGEEVLAQLDGPVFSRLFLDVVPCNAKAFLGTFLKAGVRLYRKQTPFSVAELAEAFSAGASAIDRQKYLSAFLPVIKEPDEVNRTLSAFQMNDPHTCAPLLLKAATPVCYYHLFCLLQRADHADIRPFALQLIKQNTPEALRLAGIIGQYFGLGDLPGTFSLHLPDYELSRLDKGYDKFLQIFNK